MTGWSDLEWGTSVAADFRGSTWRWEDKEGNKLNIGEDGNKLITKPFEGVCGADRDFQRILGSLWAVPSWGGLSVLSNILVLQFTGSQGQ